MPAPPPDIFFRPLPEIRRALLEGQFSVRELVELSLERLQSIGPKYNAVACLLKEPAYKEAEAVDEEFRRGRARGPLAGIPYGAKDLFATRNTPTTWGAPPYANQVFDYDATVIGKLRDARSILTAKLAMIELAGAGGYRYASASLTGPCLNPWNPAHWTGGSSSGSACAVALGLVPFSLGTETWGSIVTPAAFCGVTGLRPTFGFVSRYGAMPLAWSLDKIGIFARTAEDCALVLQAIAGGDTQDPSSAGRSFYYTPRFGRKLSDLTIAIAPEDIEEWAPEQMRPPLREAYEVLKNLGARVVEAQLPDLPYNEIIALTINAEAAAAFHDLIQSPRIDELADAWQIAGLKASLDVRAHQYLQAQRLRQLVQAELRKLFVEVDVLVSPARLALPPRIEDPLDRPSTTHVNTKRRGFRHLIAASNLAGLPALVLPCGFANGLPVAIQLVGKPFTENTLVALGKAFQDRTGWHLRRPPEVT